MWSELHSQGQGVEHSIELMLDIGAKSGEGHLPSSLSVLTLISVCFDEFDFGPHGPDTFVLSKGHGSLALYVVLNQLGHLSNVQLALLGTPGKNLAGHPERQPQYGIEASTGSLGHGLPFAAGLAHAKKLQRDSSATVVIVGDGELNEGSNWEALLACKYLGVDNLTLIVDANRSSEHLGNQEDLESKFRAFGWAVCVIDGHSEAEIRRAIRASTGTANVVIARTKKGRGVKLFEEEPGAWHHARIPPDFRTKFLGLDRNHGEKL